MSLSGFDRQLLERCLSGAPSAWNDFVDRFLGLVTHVVDHTAQSRGARIDGSTRDDLVADVFLTLIANDYAALRRFRRNCSLATYLTVISRRVVVRRLLRRNRTESVAGVIDVAEERPALRLENREEVQRLLTYLEPKEANVVKMYHLEGKSYEEISRLVGISTNAIGPLLSRAREKMRNGSDRG